VSFKFLGLSWPTLDEAQRYEAFGKNFIPPTKSKNFMRLTWEAIQDTVLLILIAAAILSIGLSFIVTKKPQEDYEDEDVIGSYLGVFCLNYEILIQ